MMQDDFCEETRYDVGEQVTPELNEELARFMLYLVAYDICEDGRLRRVAKVCEDFGVRIEKSVFECDLNRENFRELWKRLRGEIHEDEDAVVAYKICGACAKTVVSMGQIFRPGRRLCYVM